MILIESLRQAYAAISSHRYRAFMTLFGIAWGIVAVTLLMAYGDGLHNALSLGLRGGIADGTVVIGNGQTSRQAGGERAGRMVRLTEADVAALLDLPKLRLASPEYAFSHVPLSYDNRHTTTRVRGIAPDYAIMRSESVAEGRFINNADIEQHRRVVVLGPEAVRQLFSNIPPVGQTIYIKGMPFEVIGVLANRVQLFTYEAHDKYCAFIPYSSARQLWNQQYLNYLVFQADPLAHDQMLRLVRQTLAARHNFDQQDERAVRVIMDSVENNELFGTITNLLRVVLTIIGALTLMIGGVGVINIMLVSVMERTTEIGLRKALGATRGNIATQFILEALLITLLGGVIGILLSYFLMSMIGAQPFLADLLNDESGQTDIQLRLSANVLFTTTAILIFVGLTSGIWPALRAAQVDPIKSLQYE